MLINLLVVLLVGLLFAAAFVLVRTLRFARPLPPAAQVQLPDVEEGEVAGRLSALLQVPTVSHDGQPTDPAPLEALQAKMKAMYPTLHARLQRRTVCEHSLLYTWPGRDPQLEPVLLMAHMDVVPADEERWQHPPFSGLIADGFVWGRGALDMKHQLTAILEAVERLLKAGHQPEHTLYLAFGHDEEVLGVGAPAIARLLEEEGVHLAAVLDEGGMLAEGVIPGVQGPAALVGTNEKGYLTLSLSVQGTPGHSSQPPEHTAIGVLARAIAHLESNPMPVRLAAARRMMAGLGGALPFATQMAFANLWLFGGLVKRKLLASPRTAAILRSTTAVTVVNGGEKENILPALAQARVNFRLMPGDSIADVCNHARRMINDGQVHIEAGEGAHAAPVDSDTASPYYRSLETVIRQVFGPVPVSPYLVLGATDSRHFCNLSRCVYRFSPVILAAGDLGRMHGDDERISTAALARMVQFFILLIREWTVKEMPA